MPLVDAALAISIARAVVDFLGEQGFRILNAVVPAAGGEHDLVAERSGLPRLSSIEVKCKSIRKVERLFDTFRGQMRQAALKLRIPHKFSERVILLVEFDAQKPLDAGWKLMRCESFNGEWEELSG